MISRNMTIDEIIESDGRIAHILMRYGFTCLGCPWAKNETLAEACYVHGHNVDNIIKFVERELEEM